MNEIQTQIYNQVIAGLGSISSDVVTAVAGMVTLLLIILGINFVRDILWYGDARRNLSADEEASLYEREYKSKQKAKLDRLYEKDFK